MATEPKIPLGYYVYTISVADVVRYIGKGKGLRLYCHMKEVRSRLNRDYRLENIGSLLQQNLTKAVLSGAKVIEEVLMDGLTDAAAYKLEYDKLREYVFAGNRDQLWNVIPGSIYTPQELQAFAERLQRNLNSRDRWIRYLSERTLAALIRGPATRGTAPLGIDTANTQTFRIRPVTFGNDAGKRPSTSFIDSRRLGAVAPERGHDFAAPQLVGDISPQKSLRVLVAVEDMRLPAQAALQLPDQSTTIRVESFLH